MLGRPRPSKHPRAAHDSAVEELLASAEDEESSLAALEEGYNEATTLATFVSSKGCGADLKARAAKVQSKIKAAFRKHLDTRRPIAALLTTLGSALEAMRHDMAETNHRVAAVELMVSVLDAPTAAPPRSDMGDTVQAAVRWELADLRTQIDAVLEAKDADYGGIAKAVADCQAAIMGKLTQHSVSPIWREVRAISENLGQRIDGLVSDWMGAGSSPAWS